MTIRDFPGPRRVQPLTPFEDFSPTEWQGKDPPAYDWMVDGCFLRGTVAMLSGDGGLGKSLLMQQLCTAAALGKSWLGLETQPARTFAFFCEDDKDELHRRQHWINEHYGCDPDELHEVRYISRAGMENVIMEFDRRTDFPTPTPLFEQLRQAVLTHGAHITVIDTVADVFAGNEIIRNQVRRFISALRKLAIETQGCIILTAHPSNAGLASGTGISGSTAWNNSVRSRLYLTRVKAAGDADDEEDTNERFLKTMKNNQGPYGGKLKIRWERGVFVAGDQPSMPRGMIEVIEMDRLLMEGLRYLVGNGTRVAADSMSRYGFAKVVRSLPTCRAISYAAASAALDRMVASRRVVRVEMGMKSKRAIYVRPSDMLYPGETAGPDAGETE